MVLYMLYKAPKLLKNLIYLGAFLYGLPTVNLLCVKDERNNMNFLSFSNSRRRGGHYDSADAFSEQRFVPLWFL